MNSVAAGCSFTFYGAHFVSDCGEVFYFKNDENINGIPTQIPELERIHKVSCGFAFAIFLNYEGELFSSGKTNSYGELGIGDSKVGAPCKIFGEYPAIIDIYCGEYHTLCKSIDDELWTFGNNNSGACAHPIKKKYIKIIKKTKYSNINLMAGGLNFSLFTTHDRELFVCGENSYGELGIPTVKRQEKPIKVDLSFINGDCDIISLQCGALHTVILDSDGKVYTAGKNEDNRLGRKTESSVSHIFERVTLIPDFITYISCGLWHTLCVDSEFRLWTFGCNRHSELGLGDKGIRTSPNLVPDLEDITHVARGFGYLSVVKTSDGSIWTSGKLINEQNCKFNRLPEEHSYLFGSLVPAHSVAKSARK